MRKTLSKYAANAVINAVQSQRAAHDAYCSALEQKIEHLEKEKQELLSESALNYLFITKKQPGMIEEYVDHCISYEDDPDLNNGIRNALDSLGDYSDAAHAWVRRHQE